MSSETCVASLKGVLENLPRVKSVNEIRTNNKIIESISIAHEALGTIKFQRLDVVDSVELFEFYYQGLSEKSRIFFPPYPLFSPPVNSAEELGKRIADWKKEDDWTVLKLTKNDRIIGTCHLKRWKTERPVSGLAVREEFQKMGLGFLLQTVVVQQACLLKLLRLYVTVAPDNVASLRVHKKCGFKKTGRLVAHFVYKNGVKEIDRHDIEMVLELL